MRTIIALALFAPVFLFSVPVHAEQCLRVGYPPLGESIERTLIDMMNEVYEEAGLCADYEELPLARNHKYLIEGRIDASLAEGVHFIEKMSPHIIALKDEIGDADIGVIYDSSVFRADVALSTFQGQSIGLLASALVLDQVVENLNAKKDYAPTQHILINRLINGRVHSIVMAEPVFEAIRQQRGLSEQFKFLKVLNITGHHVLHKKHASKIDRLNRAMKNAIEKGTFNQRLKSETNVSR